MTTEHKRLLNIPCFHLPMKKGDAILPAKSSHRNTILNAVSYIGAAFAFSVGMLAYFSAAIINERYWSSDFAAPALTIIGIYLVVASALILLGSAGLWRIRDWARAPLVILVLFGVIMSFTSLFTGSYLSFVVGIIINGIILWQIFTAWH